MIQVRNLSFSYTKQPFITGMSFSVSSGEIFGFLGPSGAGKSTLQKVLIGMLTAYQGSAVVNGVECKKRTRRFYEDIGVDFEFSTMYEKLTARENLRFFSSLYEKEPRPIEELLEMVGLEHDADKRVSGYSKGMKARLNFIKALLHDPVLLCLDEPTSGLDPLMQNRFIDLISDEKKRGKTILMSSHIFEEVERTCGRIGIIQNGRMAAVDDADTLRRRHTRSYTVSLEDEASAEAFAADFGGTRTGLSVTVTTKQSLEEIFMNYYGGEKHDEHGAL